MGTSADYRKLQQHRGPNNSGNSIAKRSTAGDFGLTFQGQAIANSSGNVNSKRHPGALP
ncbi:hypothetical protein FHW37_1094 [Neorhizobium alkalisoli]|uniref:Uncharacterized protein n=1 Tax=Neorhizobium alkalisoli TaxID=528178 RepID=A0A561QCC9_9HYPH|nr:hypothetical protein FHW37_1094 [Neorhizobium alkalisoli]